MKRTMIGLVLAVALVAGCAGSGSPKPAPDAKKAASVKKLYFEVPKGNTVYVVATVEALATVRETGTLPKTVTDTTIDPDGLTVVFDASSDDTLKYLQAEYKSQHKKK